MTTSIEAQFNLVSKTYDENRKKFIPCFDKFYKGDKSRSINKKSMGLGLYIVKTIIRLHDGDIYVESEPGKYCRFTFHIPDEGKKKKDSHVFSKETHDE